MSHPLARALAAALCCLPLALPTAAGAQAPPCGGDTLVMFGGGGPFEAPGPCEGIPPEARFTMTPGQTTPGGTVQFDASTSTDVGGWIAAYAWDLDGDGQFDDSGETNPQFTYPAKATVTVGLEVTDDEGLVNTTTQVLAVTDPPTAELSATPASPLTGETTRLDAGASTDTDGTIVQYEWDTDGDGEPDVDTQGTSYLDHSFPLAGTFDVGVLVTDDTGATATKTIQVVVRNQPPVAAIADPGDVLVDRVTTLSAAGTTDPDLPAGASLTYDWDLDDDGTYETPGDQDGTLQHTFTAPGPVTVGVRATDETGATGTATRDLVVTHAPVVPVTATPNPVSLSQDVTLDASGASDPDDPGATLTFQWDLENDDDFAAPAGPTLTANWPAAGTYTVKVLVTDESGAQTVGSVAVVVRNLTPLAAISTSTEAPTAGEPVQLSAAGSSDPDGTIVRYQWDLDGDHAYETDTQGTPAATATFANPGTVTVGVRVTDDDGGTGTKSLVLTLAPAGSTTPPPPKPPAATPPPGDAPAGPTGGEDAPAQPAGGPAEESFTPTPERPFPAWLGGLAIQRTTIVANRGLLVSCRAVPAVQCSVTLSVSAADAKRLRLGRKATVIATSALPVPAGQSARTRVKLAPRVRRALKAHKGVRVVVKAVARTADGREVALTRVFLVRA